MYFMELENGFFVLIAMVQSITVYHGRT